MWWEEASGCCGSLRVGFIGSGGFVRWGRVGSRSVTERCGWRDGRRRRRRCYRVGWNVGMMVRGDDRNKGGDGYEGDDDESSKEEEEEEESVVMDYGKLQERMKEVTAKEALGEELVEVTEVSGESMGAEELGKAAQAYGSASKLFVIMFTRKRGEDGIYSLAMNGENFILAFEVRIEASKFAKMLEAQSLPPSKVVPMSRKDLEEFCNRTKFQLGFVPKGLIITPPDEAIGIDEWKDDGKRNGRKKKESEELKQMREKLENLFGQS
eukprot:Plantae.Rhodophyta-Hildenbrandia_rubra.ctg11955.p1 GENE.Plantae.Rhodophyta-Hildenbrandia_rubra.ctg11955~~Plantae.Rhodophyta-Hildenbrandia_rubra.ctg11955.p1  ORF type:complete len:267 (-),score=91.72 Plantae.Rhodophyta-Hildenbrandia_rubra.ctg11955:166-966(-)